MMNKFRIKLFDRSSVLCIIFFNASLSWIISVISVIHTIINTVEYLKKINWKFLLRPKVLRNRTFFISILSRHILHKPYIYTTLQINWSDWIRLKECEMGGLIIFTRIIRFRSRNLLEAFLSSLLFVELIRGLMMLNWNLREAFFLIIAFD